MIVKDYRVDLNKALQMVAVKLDLDETRHEKAEKSYLAVGEWLSAENSPLTQYIPEIYPQGSFILGTVISRLRETMIWILCAYLKKDLVFHLKKHIN